MEVPFLALHAKAHDFYFGILKILHLRPSSTVSLEQVGSKPSSNHANTQILVRHCKRRMCFLVLFMQSWLTCILKFENSLLVSFFEVRVLEDYWLDSIFNRSFKNLQDREYVGKQEYSVSYVSIPTPELFRLVVCSSRIFYFHLLQTFFAEVFC